ncbi:MAG: ethanolamine ammonia-lyase reactivating factor EutA, partial [Bacillota bacterium]
VPVVKPFDGGLPGDEEEITTLVVRALRMIDSGDGGEAVAIAIRIPQPGFAEVMRLARGIDGAFGDAWNSPVVVVTDGDFGKVLGQTLKSIDPGRAVVCIDQVRVESGDYIDIGEPLYSGSVVPVVVKTLVFSH